MNRRNRRANPSQWYKFDAYQLPDGVHGLGEKYSQYVRGELGELVVVAIPSDLPPAERQAFMEGFRETIALVSDQLKFVMVPDTVQMLRLSPVSPEVAKDLNRQLRMRQVSARIRATTPTCIH